MEKAFSGEIEVSPTRAKREANNYLSRDVSTGLYAEHPTLIWGGEASLEALFKLALTEFGDNGNSWLDRNRCLDW
ncbi:hypothetical protein KFU94_00330 [Chloroflexi bacterium TSY]|nr:hypothetical protein [Chloroflexi bacterium TSY]